VINDTDLLRLDPTLLDDYRPRTQTLALGEADVDEFTLTATSGVSDFASARVGVGSVLIIDRTPLEVMAVVGPATLLVSRLRPDGEGGAILPNVKSGGEFECVTFLPQIRTVHTQLLRMAGIEPELAGLPGQATAAMIMNAGALALANALGALALIYVGAGAGLPGESPMLARSVLFQRRFEAEVERCTLHLDMNGDGRPDAVRKLSGGPMLR
jgi:hypothetical protein